MKRLVSEHGQEKAWGFKALCTGWQVSESTPGKGHPDMDLTKTHVPCSDWFDPSPHGHNSSPAVLLGTYFVASLLPSVFCCQCKRVGMQIRPKQLLVLHR